MAGAAVVAAAAGAGVFMVAAGASHGSLDFGGAQLCRNVEVRRDADCCCRDAPYNIGRFRHGGRDLRHRHQGSHLDDYA